MAKSAVEALDPAEHVPAMEEMLAEMRKNSSWRLFALTSEGR